MTAKRRLRLGTSFHVPSVRTRVRIAHGMILIGLSLLTGACAHTPRLELDTVVAGASEVRWLAGDSTIAVALLGRGVAIVDAATGEERAAWRQAALPAHPARGLATSALGETLAVATEDSVRVIRARDGALLFSAQGGGLVLALSGDGRALAWGDGTYGRVLDVPSGRVRSEHAATADRSGLLWSTATASFAWTDAHTVRFEDADGRLVGELAPFEDAAPSQLALSVHGVIMAVAESTTFVSFWDVRGAHEQRRLRLEGGARFERMAFSADTRYLGLARDGRARILAALTGHTLADWQPNSGGAVRDMAFSRSGDRLATVGPDGHVRLWEVPPTRRSRP